MYYTHGKCFRAISGHVRTFGVMEGHFGDILGYLGAVLGHYGAPWASEKGPRWSNMTYNHVIFPWEVF